MRELSTEHVSGLDRHHLVNRSRQNHVTGMQLRPERRELVRKPRHTASRIAERGGSGAGVDQLTAPADGDTDESQVEFVDSAQPSAHHNESRRRVVGHRVDQLDLPVRNPRVDDLHSRQRSGDRPQRGRRVCAGPFEVTLHDEGHLGFDSRLHEPFQIDHVAVLDEHAVQQHAVVGFVDAEQFLHRLRRQSDLAATDPLAVLDPPVDVHRLDRVSVLDGQIRMLIGKRRYRDRRLIGLP